MATGGISNREEIVSSFVILDNDDKLKYIYSEILDPSLRVDLKRNAKSHLFRIIFFRNRMRCSSSH
jgi:hypothetical protein